MTDLLSKINITPYWIFYPTAFCLCLYYGLYCLNQSFHYLTKNSFLKLIFTGWLGAIIGGRAGYILFYNFKFYQQNPDQIFNLFSGGMSFHGALFGFFILSYLYSKKIHSSFPVFIDICALVTPIALLIGRFGNFIQGELWGRASNVPWAMVFEKADNLTRHPSQLYEAFFEGFVLFIIINVANKILHLKPGALSIIFIIFYGTFRFFIEYYREPDPQIGFIMAGLTLGQVLSASMAIGGAITWVIYKPHSES